MKPLPNDIFFAQVESEIASGKSVRFKVKGFSMFPLLRNDIDEVLLSPVAGQPKIMDIVLFRYKGKHILHRIIDVKDGRFIIQGDGIYLTSEHCKEEDIVGVVTSIYKRGWKPFNVSSGIYRCLSMIWLKLRFCRRYLLAIARRVYK